jgi:hypothetical protein
MRYIWFAYNNSNNMTGHKILWGEGDTGAMYLETWNAVR